MKLERLGDAVVGTVGDAAGAVVDPRAGLGRIRAAMSSRALIGVAAALVAGYLVGRLRRHA
ncbi:hypothetical protein [Polymorphospora rubra]|uniref:hypothetical protein n=1 Tax=Polymorphospora rubra TaxID=338584 RepID=UPI0033CD1ADC